MVTFGIFFVSFGMVFVWIFFPWRFWDEFLLRGKGARETSGLVNRVSDTHITINEAAVYEFHFLYTPEGSTQLAALCYAPGRNWSENDVVTVRYLPDRPQVALINGASLNEGGLFGAFVIIFPLAGCGMAIGVLVLRGRSTRLLREGLLAEVDVLSVDGTTMEVNDQPVFRITLSAPGTSGRKPIVIRRYDVADVNLATRHAQQKQPVFVLYDPRKPKRLVFPEALID